MRSPRASHLFFLALIAIAGCKKDDIVQPTTTDLKQVLTHTTNDIIVSIYNKLDAEAAHLVADIATLRTTPTQANLDHVREAWRDARVPWENSEAFLFGPVETNGIDPSIDSWPVNTVDLDAVLASSDSLTQSYIDGLEGTLKGFHTIEYLIFGANGSKQIGDFTSRQFQYLVALAQSLKGQTARLANAWSASGQNFGANIINAGTSSNSLYPSQKSALEELANGMLGIADEVANGKINDPFSQSDITLEESRFSANSKADFQDNIRGILYIYTGAYNSTTGSSVSDVVKQYDASLDTRVRTTVQTAIDKIGAIPGTFTTAIFNSRPAVQDAQTAVRNVQQILEGEVLPLIQNRVQ